MRMNKKAFTALSFAVGAMVFMTTAFADVALGSGYDRLKDTIKRTTGQMESGLKSYTFETLITLKDNGKVLDQSSNFMKIDNEKAAREETTVSQHAGENTYNRYYYTDKQCHISKSGEAEEKYYLTDYSSYSKSPEFNSFRNPFKEKGANEVEKIFDALVGNLKNYVQVEERPEGGREYSGSLSEAQVPALANAVSSFGIKKMLGENRTRGGEPAFPAIESDIYIKSISGKAVESKSGLLESMTAEVTMIGNDKQGVQHEITVDAVMKVSGVNKTVVTKPDLTGKKVEKVSRVAGFDSKYLGKYKNDIVMEKDGKFIKIGERVLEITHIDDKKVSGSYKEICKPGYEADYPDRYDFTFDYIPDVEPMSTFTYTNASGEKEIGRIHTGGSGKLYLQLNVEIIDKNSYRSKDNIKRNKIFNDNEYYKVFEE